MTWAIAGLVYAAVYAAAMTALAGQDATRLLIGNIALLLPPLAPLYVLAARRHAWRGRQAVFWSAIAVWAALWLLGQLGWASDELLHASIQPWFRWHIVLQLSGSALPLIALVAWPHRSAPAEPAITVAIDITVLGFLTAFLYWSLIIAPAANPDHAAMGLRSLAIIGPIVRLACVAGLLWAATAAGKNAWAGVYRRLALGMGLAFVILVVLSVLTVRGAYQTGSPADVGWMLPFFFAAWAAAASPASAAETRPSPTRPLQQTSPVLLFVALLTVPVVGYGLRYFVPFGEPVDTLRDIATACTLVCGIALVLVRLRVEQRLGEQANERLRLLATACEQAGELIIIVRDQRIEYANDAFCRAVGYSLAELEQVAPLDLVAPESHADLPALREQLRQRRTARATTVMARRDGSTFPAAWVAAPILDANGRVTCIVAVVRDLTEEERLREQLVRGERLSALGEFVSGVAHEINNPLQSVIGSLELVLDQHLDPAIRGDVERARFEAGRAGRTVRSLLRFVRQAPNERLLLDLNEIVKATMAVRAYELEMAGIQVREEYAPLLPLVLANREEIQQVILNLVMNAQQAMSGPGAAARVLSLRTFMAGPDAVLEVRDTGPGIPTELSGKIFEPFFTTRSVGAGSGLGLSLSLGIAAAHQGQLELVDAASGCCFRLTLPGSGFPGPASVH